MDTCMCTHLAIHLKHTYALCLIHLEDASTGVNVQLQLCAVAVCAGCGRLHMV